MQQYLSAYLGEDLPERAVEAIASTPGGLAEVRTSPPDPFSLAGWKIPLRESRQALEIREKLP